ncbi:MAG TPA: bacillithiol biosynthesis deacetylase BshB2 [Trueperaceae bacterium]|nr:bacillithiol biosynthesis deacetylase BshB2 [Trueperaceae bacterium]
MPNAVDVDQTTQAFVPQEQEALLVVLPHPDDESFSSGGTLSLCADAGVPATYLCGTYGDMGRRMGNPPVANRESLRDVRVVEMRAAAEVLGIAVEFLGLRDKCVEFEDADDLAARIASYVTTKKASTVITFYPGFGVHPDHDAIGHATVLAVRSLPPRERPLLLGVAVTGADAARAGLDGAKLGEPEVTVDISAVYKRKIAALKAHNSQTATMFAQWVNVWDPETLEELPGAPEPDAQTIAWRDRLTKRERFYVLDPDARTLRE